MECQPHDPRLPYRYVRDLLHSTPAATESAIGSRTGATGGARAQCAVRYRRIQRQNTRLVRSCEGPPPMLSLTHDAVIDAMRTVQEPELGRDIVDPRHGQERRHRRVRVVDDHRADDAGLPAEGRDRADDERRPRRDRRDDGRHHLGRMVRRARRARPSSSCPGVKNIIAVASGKGGVGKSTVASTSRSRSPRPGQSVGLLDADITGPNIPLMMGSRASPRRAPRTRSCPSSATA